MEFNGLEKGREKEGEDVKISAIFLFSTTSEGIEDNSSPFFTYAKQEKILFRSPNRGVQSTNEKTDLILHVLS